MVFEEKLTGWRLESWIILDRHLNVVQVYSLRPQLLPIFTQKLDGSWRRNRDSHFLLLNRLLL